MTVICAGSGSLRTHRSARTGRRSRLALEFDDRDLRVWRNALTTRSA